MNLGCLVAIVFVHQLLSDATALPSVVKIGESILSITFLVVEKSSSSSEFIYYFLSRNCLYKKQETQVFYCV